MSPTPDLSVVVAASDSAEAVARTLASLSRQRGKERAEIIIADEAGTGVPRLRRIGFDRATAPVVVFTEDSCVFGPDWLDSWRRAFDDPCTQAATGPVLPDMGDSPLDWAVFFCEYAPFFPDEQDQTPPTRLAGNNFAARRSALAPRLRDEIHESEVAHALAGRAGGLTRLANARAWHVRRYSLREALGDRLRFGHQYGRFRARSWPSPARLACFFAGPTILGVQAARLTRLMLARPRYLGRFLESLPITLALLSAWSVGEWLGWLTAPLPSGLRTQQM